MSLLANSGSVSIRTTRTSPLCSWALALQPELPLPESLEVPVLGLGFACKQTINMKSRIVCKSRALLKQGFAAPPHIGQLSRKILLGSLTHSRCKRCFNTVQSQSKNSLIRCIELKKKVAFNDRLLRGTCPFSLASHAFKLRSNKVALGSFSSEKEFSVK